MTTIFTIQSGDGPDANRFLMSADAAHDLSLGPVPSAAVVSINSDDPAYFGGYVDDNFAAITSELALTPQQLGTLAENSFTSSFLPEADKETLRRDVKKALENDQR